VLLGKPESGKEQEKVGMAATLSLSKPLAVKQLKLKPVQLFIISSVV